jgi:endonuclease G
MLRLSFRLGVLALAAWAALAQDNLRFGNPGCDGADREEADRRFFHLCHSTDLKIPLWVAYELKKEDLDGPAPRPSGFRQDTGLMHPGARDKDYTGEDYARGHMAPAEDFDRSDEAIHMTFLLSNVVPQRQSVNNGRWKQLEVAVRKLAKQGRVYVITGPIFARATVDTIGDDEVGIPTHTFKVVLAIDGDGKKTMYAAIMPNTETVSKPMNAYATTVKEVERRSGLDFFTALDDSERRKLEVKRESFPAPATKSKPKGHP